jgi:hypothetical protein
MKIKTDIHAGYSTYQECQKDLNYWKTMAQAMDAYSKTGAWPSDLPYPTVPTTPTYPPTYPTYPTTGGGYVNGVYYPDYSGYCSGTTPPPTPPSTGGGYVNGVYYADYSGYCGE